MKIVNTKIYIFLYLHRNN